MESKRLACASGEQDAIRLDHCDRHSDGLPKLSMSWNLRMRPYKAKGSLWV